MSTIVNFAKTYLTQQYTSSATTFTVKSGTGSKFGAVPFNATVWNSTDYADASDDPFVEIVTVTSVSGDILTVTRGQEGLTATAKNMTGKTYAIAQTYTALVANAKLDGPIGTSAWRVKNDALQLYSTGDSLFHSVWLTGTAGTYQLNIGPGEA